MKCTVTQMHMRHVLVRMCVHELQRHIDTDNSVHVYVSMCPPIDMYMCACVYMEVSHARSASVHQVSDLCACLGEKNGEDTGKESEQSKRYKSWKVLLGTSGSRVQGLGCNVWRGF